VHAVPGGLQHPPTPRLQEQGDGTEAAPPSAAAASCAPGTTAAATAATAAAAAAAAAAAGGAAQADVRGAAIRSGVLMGLSVIMVATARDPSAMTGSWNGRGQEELPTLAVCCLLTPGGPRQCRRHPQSHRGRYLILI